MTIEAFPLSWPKGRARTSWRDRARFMVSVSKARDSLVNELSRLGARNVIISTDIPLRNNGLLYANFKQPNDPAVAVYFSYKKRQMCFACDRWDRIQDNLQAVNHTIAALRGISRWGTGDMMESAFSGFTALPAPVESWRLILEFGEDEIITEQGLIARWKTLRSKHHPDKGGDANTFAQIKNAYVLGCENLGITP